MIEELAQRLCDQVLKLLGRAPLWRTQLVGHATDSSSARIQVCAPRTHPRHHASGSLNFVKLALPDGKDYTLPQAVSASGARYTDDHEVVWWNKGKEGFVEMRDDAGEWQSRYNDCKEQ